MELIFPEIGQEGPSSSNLDAEIQSGQLVFENKVLNYPSLFLTSSLKTFPSTRFPTNLALAAFMTAPICF